MGFTPSKYQQAIFDRGVELISAPGKTSLVINAGPGSGKSTTAKQFILGCIPEKDWGSTLYTAMNSHVVDEMKGKLPERLHPKWGNMQPIVDCKTVHSLGRASIVKHIKGQRRGWKPPYSDYHDASLDRKFAQDWMMQHKDRLQLDSEEWREATDAIVTLISACQLTVTDYKNPDAIWKVIDHYGLTTVIPCADLAISALPEIFQRKLAEMHQHITFNDMLWIPLHLNLFLWQYQTVLADESQDFNRAQRWIVQRSTKKNGTIIWLGDERQSIYGFSFASTRSIKEIIAETNAEILPLPVCYRCPTSHIDLCREIYPESGLEPRPGAPEGDVIDIYDWQTADHVQQGDLIICRVNAPLIPLCFTLIRQGIGARIKGRDIGKNLVSLAEKIEKQRDDGINWAAPHENVREWARGEAAMIERKIPDAETAALAIANLTDKIETLLAIWEGNHPTSLRSMISEIEALFADERAAVWLSTIHKAKGLEAENVFILAPSKMPHPMARKPWEREQEENMRYIAYSRAKARLIFAWNEDEPGCPPIDCDPGTEPQASQPESLEALVERELAAATGARKKQLQKVAALLALANPASNSNANERASALAKAKAMLVAMGLLEEEVEPSDREPLALSGRVA